MSGVPAIEVLGQGIGQPATHYFLITPSDTNELQYITRGFRVGTAGDLALQRRDGTVITVPDVLAGETLPYVAKKVYATNTTASGIMGLA